MSHNVRNDLETGLAILTPFLASHGFKLDAVHVGRGSGGWSASGTFARGDRPLEFHHRTGLGIIVYRIGDLWLDHEAYLRHLGVERDSEWLWLPVESGLDGYRALLSDLECFGGDFLSGSATDWKLAAERTSRNRSDEKVALNASAVGDNQKRTQAREMFRERNYIAVVDSLNSIHFPELLSDSERRMLTIAKRHISY